MSSWNLRNLRNLAIGAALLNPLVLPVCAQQDPNFEMGKQLYSQGRYEEALKYLNLAAKTSRSPTVFYYEALTLQRGGHVDAATRVYSDICKIFPTSQEARLSKAFLQAGSGAAPTRSTSVVTTTVSRSASSRESLPDETKVPFRRADSGHLWVNATINNRPMEVLFDTGASSCVFGSNQFDAAGIKPQMTGQQVALAGVGSGVVNAGVGIVDVRIGDLSRRLPVTIAPNLKTPPLLGQPFFAGYQYDIDNQGGFIHFMKSSGAGASRNEPLDAINVPFVVQGGDIVVQAKVNGRDCPMYFDTGAPACVFSQASAEAIGLSIPSDATPVMSGGIGGANLAFQFPVSRIELGGVCKTNLPITVMKTGGPPLPLLGQSFFRDRRYSIDSANHVIRFTR